MLGNIFFGLSIIIAPFFLLISNILQSRGFSNINDLLSDIAKRPVENEFSFAFAIYGYVLFIPAVAGILFLFKNRSSLLMQIGAGLLILGAVSLSFIAGTESIIYIAGADKTLGQNLLINVNNILGRSCVYNLINITGIVGWFFGTITTAVALFSERIVPRFLAVMLGLAIVIRFVLAGNYIATIFSDVLYTLVFSFIGYRIMR